MANLMGVLAQMSLRSPDDAILLGQVAALLPKGGGPGGIEEFEAALTAPYETIELPLRKLRVSFDDIGELLWQ